MVRLLNTAVRRLLGLSIVLGGAIPGLSHAACSIEIASTSLGRANSAEQLKSMLGEVRNGTAYPGTAPAIKYRVSGCALGNATVRAAPVNVFIGGAAYIMIPWLVSLNEMTVPSVNLATNEYQFQFTGNSDLGIVFVPQNFPEDIAPDVYIGTLNFEFNDAS